MTLIPLVLLVAAGARIVLDDAIEIPRAEWRYVDIEVKEPMAVVNCEYQVISENSPVRVVWVARQDLENFRHRRRENILAATPFGIDGKLRQVATASGDYALVFENQPSSRAPVKVKVKAWFESVVSPRELSARRRLAVILISTLVFFSIVSFSAFKLRGQIP